MSAVELRHLRALVALTEEGTFTYAAIRLGITQSGVSRTIVALERAVAADLVVRTTRSVALTDAGMRCYRAALAALTAVDDVAAAVHGGSRPLRLGYAWSALGRHTTAVLQRWRREQPQVPLEVHRVDDRDGGISRARADVAIIRGAVTDAALSSTLLLREPRVAALPATHPLAGRSSVVLGELTHETVLTTSYGTTSLELWPASERPAHSLHVDNTDEWLTEIAGGLAIGVTAESTASQHAHPGVAFVPLESVDPVDVHLAWPRRNHHPAVPDFVELAARVVRG